MGSVCQSRKVSHTPTNKVAAALHVAVFSFACADYGGDCHCNAWFFCDYKFMLHKNFSFQRSGSVRFFACNFLIQ